MSPSRSVSAVMDVEPTACASRGGGRRGAPGPRDLWIGRASAPHRPRPGRYGAPSAVDRGTRLQSWPGTPYPLGATFDGGGTNFALFSEVADRVELCLLDDEGTETRVEVTESTAHVWHVHVPGVAGEHQLRKGLREGHGGSGRGPRLRLSQQASGEGTHRNYLN